MSCVSFVYILKHAKHVVGYRNMRHAQKFQIQHSNELFRELLGNGFVIIINKTMNFVKWFHLMCRLSRFTFFVSIRSRPSTKQALQTSTPILLHILQFTYLSS